MGEQRDAAHAPPPTPRSLAGHPCTVCACGRVCHGAHTRASHTNSQTSLLIHARRASNAPSLTLPQPFPP
eukprot:365841-Chlamydomonas_euryale.AAC.2